MDNTPYSNRELDEKFNRIEEKLDLIVVQTTATNGKVRKIFLALSILFGISIGLGFEQAKPLISLISLLL